MMHVRDIDERNIEAGKKVTSSKGDNYLKDPKFADVPEHL